MTQYRIVLIDREGAELSSGYLFAVDDMSACESGERLMRSNARAAAVRVLRDDRLVCSYEQA